MRRGGERYKGWIIATFLIYTINPFFLEDPHVHASVLSCPTGLPPYMAEIEEECSVSLRQVYIEFLEIFKNLVFF